MNLNELFAQTLSGGYDDELPWEAVSKLREIGSREIFEKAATWCQSENALQRARGADVLAQLGRTWEHPSNNYPEESFTVVADLAVVETVREPLSSAIHALGHLGDLRAVPIIVRYDSHIDSEIRFAVACACGSFGNDQSAAETLLKLMRDEDDDVRDWATFGLGTQSELDTPAIREALFAALGDSCEEVKREALAGLARRRDRRILPLLCTQLQQPEIDVLTIEAACEMLDLPLDSSHMTPSDYIAALQKRFDEANETA